MKTGPFNRQAISANPFGSGRDVRLFVGILVTVCVAIYVGLKWLGSPDRAVYAAMIGACLGTLPSLAGSLPVMGWISPKQKGWVLARLAQWKYRVESDDGDAAVYLPLCPRSMRWDSNRVIVRDLDDEKCEVTLPLFVAWRLNRAKPKEPRS